jgi:hypothetical protein
VILLTDLLSVSGDGAVYLRPRTISAMILYTYTIPTRTTASAPATVSNGRGNVNDPPRISACPQACVEPGGRNCQRTITVLDDDTEDTHNASVSLVSESYRRVVPRGQPERLGGTISLWPGANKYVRP